MSEGRSVSQIILREGFMSERRSVSQIILTEGFMSEGDLFLSLY